VWLYTEWKMCLENLLEASFLKEMRTENGTWRKKRD